MKTFFITILSFLISFSAYSQTPYTFKYQAVIRDANGVVLANQSVKLTVKVLPKTGAEVYSEIHEVQTNQYGLVNLEIGSKNTPKFSQINWSQGGFKLAVELGNVLIGTNDILTVPYAIHAKTAESISGGIQYTDLINTPTTISAAESTKLAAISGTNTGDQDGSETKITAGKNVSITGTGTVTSPYVVNAFISMTKSERDALTPYEGLIVYNTTSHKPNYHNGIEWMNFNGTSANTVLVGDRYGGGIAAYIFQSGDPGYVPGETHGLIAAPSDLSTGIKWDNGASITTGATGVILGSGVSNTKTIVNKQGDGNYAAQLCDDLSLDGYSDWFLPSKDELNKLYINRAAIGGFTSAWYWSSSEEDSSTAWNQGFQTGPQISDAKTDLDNVRAIRTF